MRGLSHSMRSVVCAGILFLLLAYLQTRAGVSNPEKKVHLIGMAENRGYSRLVVQNTEIKCCGKAINHKTIGEKKRERISM